MRTLIILAATLCATPIFAQPQGGGQMFPTQPRTPGPRVRPAEVSSQIEQDLEDFSRSFNNASFAATPVYNGYDYVDGARVGAFGASDWTRQVKTNLGRAKLVIDFVRNVKRDGDSASALVNFHFKFPDSVEQEKRIEWELPREEKVQFKLAPQAFAPAPARWKIVAPATQPPALSTDFYSTLQADLNFWANAAYHLSQNYRQADGSAAEISINKLKNLGLGVLQLAQDYNETYAFDAAHLIEAVSPYVAGSSVFQVPDTNEIYAFNGNLSGKNLAALNEPYQTVLFYEGQDETPIFRYDGKAAICFADGHVALVSPDEAKNLIWKP